MAKLIPWTRAIVLILSMILTQTPLVTVSAAPEPIEITAPVVEAAPDAGESVERLASALASEGAGGVPRQQEPQLINECKVKVLAAAVEDYVKPNPIFPPQGTNNPTPFGAIAVTDHS